MVNMYGAGKAFNLRYQQHNHRMMPRPAFQHAQQKALLFGCHGHHHHGPQNVTINQGPQGFWGFMSGLFGGLFGGGMMGGLFGGGMMGGLFGPFNQIGGMGGYGMGVQQNPQDQTQAQQLQNLKTLFPDYSIVSEDGGKFSTISKKDGSVISGTYEEMKTKLAADKGAKPEKEDDDTVKKDDDTVKKDDDTVKKDDDTVKKDDDTVKKDDDTVKKDDTTTTGGGSGSRINIDGWYRSNTKTGDENKNLQLRQCKTAGEVMAKVISSENKMDFLGAEDKADLVKQLIANNPSVFNSDGTVKANANWDKLDLPSIKWIQDRYVSERSNNGAQVTYTSKVSGSRVSNTSQTAGAQQANKTKAYTATITFAIHTMGFNQGSGKATFTDSAGKTHTFTASTGASLTATNARKDIAEQIAQKIKDAGFTNVTLNNPSGYEF